MDILDDEKTGGPAHPCGEIRTHDTGDIVQNADQGVTKRDYFATHAPIDFATACLIWGDPDVTNLTNDATRAAFFAVWAMARYEFADAMMEKRK